MSDSDKSRFEPYSIPNPCPRVGDIVRVEWRDSYGCGNWQSREDAAEWRPSEIETFGRVMEIDPGDYIKVAGTYSDDQVLGCIAIPWGCITQFTIIDQNWTTPRSED